MLDCFAIFIVKIFQPIRLKNTQLLIITHYSDHFISKKLDGCFYKFYYLILSLLFTL